MKKREAQVDKKKAYTKPVLEKHGNLKEITGLAARIGSGPKTPT